MEKEQLQELRKKILSAPSDWTLILGDIHECMTFDQKKTEILSLLKEYNLDELDAFNAYNYIVNKDYTKLKDIVFGDIWDGSGFMDEISVKQIEKREKYAKKLLRKENIDIELVHEDLSRVLTVFPGTILTVCRDEIVEAFLEYENSKFVDELVWTPYDIVTSPRWKKWVDLQEENRRFYNFCDLNENKRLLIKLYGSCKDPSNMPLSEKDFEKYYPSNENETLIKKYIRNIFKNTNLVFWGYDSFSLKDTRNQTEDKKGLPFVSGIFNILETTKSTMKERYFIRENGDKEEWYSTYGLKPIQLSEIEWLIKQGQESDWKSYKEESGKDLLLEIESGRLNVEKEKLFWFLYNRRQQDEISEEESNILKKKILENSTDYELEGYKNIKKLAMIANSCADFYDLNKSLKLKKLKNQNNNGGKEGNLLDAILQDKISKECQALLDFLKFYGAGFPLGFLQLLENEECTLEKLKRLGFQLTNTGIVAKRKYRKNLYKRMEYADSIMITAGINPHLDRRKLKRLINALEHHLDDSYFYPLDEDISNSTNVPGEVQEMQKRMLNRLLEILEEKQEGYHKVRSLLETEVYRIVEVMESLERDKVNEDLKLLYYLTLESGTFPKCREEFWNSLGETIKNLENDDKVINKIRYLLIDAMKKSQSKTEQELKDALGICCEAEKLFKSSPAIGNEIVKQGITIYFVKNKLYGRIYELAFDKEKIISEMDNNLEQAKEYLKQKNSQLQNQDLELLAQLHQCLGECYFKKWMYELSLKETSQTNENFIKDARSEFNQALKYYQKYPHKYKIQCADVILKIANLSINSFDLDYVECYSQLIKAYELYRLNSDLHGIADVLRSMGELEYYYYKQHKKEIIKEQGNGRSYLSFFKTAKDIYVSLGDEWSCFTIDKYLNIHTK